MRAEIAIIGAGVMGANLALNFASHGRRVALFDLEPGKAEAAAAKSELLSAPGPEIAELIAALEPPRALILLTPAGAQTDAAIEALAPHLDEPDALIDCGNANFHDTIRRASHLSDRSRRYLGVGVSGGAEGARTGPAIMAGGDPAGWARVEPLFMEAAARFDGEPCCAWLGTDGAGHFVKTLHNGVEYADMQMIAEIYGLLRDGLGAAPSEIAEIFARWNEGPLKSYLVEITGKVAAAIDPETRLPMLEVIQDTAGQKGTGRWAAIEALHLGAPAPVIEAAVTARNLSAAKDRRLLAERLYGAAPRPMGEALGSRAETLATLEQALLAGKLLAYAQGFAVLAAGSTERRWNLPLSRIAKLWRAGCIIRAALLDEIAVALGAAPETPLLLSDGFVPRMNGAAGALRRTVAAAALHGAPIPALASALAYFDIARTGRSTANLLQAQRDFFGAHGFERVDQPGPHHGPW